MSQEELNKNETELTTAEISENELSEVSGGTGHKKIVKPIIKQGSDRSQANE